MASRKGKEKGGKLIKTNEKHEEQSSLHNIGDRNGW